MTAEQALEEELFLGLRQLEGIDLARVEERYGVSLQARIAGLREQGLLEMDGAKLRLGAGPADGFERSVCGIAGVDFVDGRRGGGSAGTACRAPTTVAAEEGERTRRDSESGGEGNAAQSRVERNGGPAQRYGNASDSGHACGDGCSGSGRRRLRRRPHGVIGCRIARRRFSGARRLYWCRAAAWGICWRSWVGRSGRMK